MLEVLEQKLYAVAVVLDLPQLELAAKEYVFPISVQDGQFKLLCWMRSARSSEIKRFYDQMMIRRRSRGRSEMEYRTSDLPGVRAFVDDHFVRMEGATLEDGTEPSHDDQREWLNQNDSFKIRIFREGYDAFADWADDEPAMAKGKPMLILSRPEHTIRAAWKLYSEGTKSEETIKLSVTFEKLTKADSYQYEKSFRIIENLKTSDRYVETNWDVIEGIFDRKAKKIAGALIDGAPCDESNREQWIKMVPFSLKVFCLAKIGEEVEIKNA